LRNLSERTSTSEQDSKKSTAELEGELVEAEKRMKIAEQLAKDAPSIAEKLRLVTEQLEAAKDVQTKSEAIIDYLVRRSREISEHEIELYKKLQKIMPQVVAEVQIGT